MKLLADEPRTQKLSDQAVASREAIAVARPFNALVDGWQIQIATLSVLANRSGKGIERLVELSDRARVLGRAIDDEQLAFDAVVKSLPQELATNPRIGNTRRNFAKASAAIQSIRAILAAS